MPQHIVFIELSLTGAGEKAVEYALSRGHYVTIVTRNPNKYASAELGAADIFTCETNELEELASGIRHLDKVRKIDGITTTADFYVPQAAYAAEVLGLPAMPYEAAMRARNKYLMRLSLQELCPHLNPKFRLVKTEGEALETAKEWGFPLIAKPQDANDSFNVKRVHSDAELAAYMKESLTWSHNGAGQKCASGVLLEECIEGEEFSVETAQHKGAEIQHIGVTGKVLTGVENGYFVEAGVYFPVSGPDADILFAEVALALSKLKIDCGVIHTECRIKDGKVRIIEINPRLMGDMAGSHMIEAALGASPIQQVVEIALGNHVPWQPTMSKGGAMYGTLMSETGIFCEIQNMDLIRNMLGVVAVKLVAQPGQRYSYPPTSNGDFLLRLVTGADTSEQALEWAKKAASSAKIKILTEEGI